jgi:general secretion pathway protein G
MVRTLRGFKADRRPRVSEAGFTLIELLVVLVILGLLAAVAAPQAMKYLGGAKTSAARVQIEALASNLDLFRLDVGRLPTQQEGLAALLEKPATAEHWNGPYIKRREQLVDPWGNAYVYRYPGQHGEYDLYSLGEKGEAGGEKTALGNW